VCYKSTAPSASVTSYRLYTHSTTETSRYSRLYTRTEARPLATNLMLAGGILNTQHDYSEYWFVKQHATNVTEYSHPRLTTVVKPSLNAGQPCRPTQFQSMRITSVYTNTTLSRYSLCTHFSCSNTPPPRTQHVCIMCDTAQLLPRLSTFSL
jgi:hypothetical protein